MPHSRERIVELDRRHVWRPYTSTDDQMSRDPIVVVAADGPWLVDVDGRRYLDANSSWWTCNLGHRHPRLVRVLREQSERLCHAALAGMTHPQAVLLARELVAVAPGSLTRVFFSDDGSTSVEVALKIALQHHRQNGEPARTRFVSLAGAYHGDTTGAMSLGGIEGFTAPYAPLLFDVIRPERPESADGWELAVAEIERRLETDGATIAAVVVEPILQGAAGMRIWPAELLTRLREATRAAGVLLVADEVFTGLGRTGPMWACEHAGVAPDLLCTAKGLAGGVLPFAATLATDAIFASFSGGPDRALMHGHTFCGHALGAALAREVLAIYRDDDVLAGAARNAPLVKTAFELIGRIPGVTNARAIGLVGAVDVGEPGWGGKLGTAISDAARRRGVYLRPLGNVVYVVPPLTIARDDLDRLLSTVAASIDEVLASR